MPKTRMAKDRPAWQAKRREVIARAAGRCERCRIRRGVHVHHLRYAAVIGHEPLDWLQLLCLDCHGREHPHHEFVPVEEQRRRHAQRMARQRQTQTGHGGCAYCGGTYPKDRHRAICVRFGLDRRAAHTN